MARQLFLLNTLAALILILTAPVFAKNCEKDTLFKTMGSGSMLITSSRQIYKVGLTGVRESKSWQAGAHLLVCTRTEDIQGIKETYLNIVNIDADSEISARKMP